MKIKILFSLCILIFSTSPILSKTIRSTFNGNWSQSGIWDSNTVPGENDDVIISQGDTVTLDYGLTNRLVICHSLTVYGTLVLGEGYYDSPETNLLVYGSLSIGDYGTIQPAPDTTNIASSFSHSISIGGDFSNYGTFVPSMSNSQNSIYSEVTMTGSLVTIDAYQKTHINSLVILKYTTLTGLLYCHSLELYSTFNNTNGILSIDNNGSVLLDSSASFAFQPRYGNNVFFELGPLITTTASLPDSIYKLDLYGNLTLDKSITITNRISLKTNNNAYIYTGSDTLTLGDSASFLIDNDYHNYVIGNLAREFRSRDSLVFLVGTPGLAQARPIAIKLNNLPASGTKITVTASDSLVNMNSLPPDISAYEKYYFWKIKPSAGYAGNVDADVSLSFNDEYHNIQQLDYIHNSLAVTVLQGNQTTGQWNVVNNNLGNSALAIPANSISTVNARVKSFGDFTVGQLYKLPNGNFETWQYGWPYGWKERVKAYATGIIQSDSAHSGSYATEGTVITGYNNDVVVPDMKFSIPFLKYPQAVKGFYQFYPVNGDKYYIEVKLYKDSNIVGQGSFIDSSGTSSYKEFNIGISLLTQIPGDTAGSSIIDSLSIETGIKPGNSNSYHLGSRFLLDDLSFGKITEVKSSRNNIPGKFTLYQNYPNPFNPTTTIKLDNPKSENIKLIIYNILGQKVATVFNGNLSAGRYTFSWNADNFSSGIYFCRLTAGSYSLIKKMVLEK